VRPFARNRYADRKHHVLNCVRFRVEDGHLTLTATDGYTIAQMDVYLWPGSACDPWCALVPEPWLGDVLRHITRTDTPVRLGLGAETMSVAHSQPRRAVEVGDRVSSAEASLAIPILREDFPEGVDRILGAEHPEGSRDTLFNGQFLARFAGGANVRLSVPPTVGAPVRVEVDDGLVGAVMPMVDGGGRP
jgi:hypothetical protein